MDLSTLVAHWTGQLPPGFVLPAIAHSLPTCRHTRCKRQVAIKNDGTPAKSCQQCLDRRAASCRRRRAALTAEGGCRRCAYRKRLEGDYLCRRCRDERDVERARKQQDAIDAAAIDDFAAQPDRAHNREQSGLRRLSLERKAEAAAQRRVLVAAAGSRAGRRPGLAVVAGQRQAAPALLIPPFAVETRRLRSSRPSAAANCPTGDTRKPCRSRCARYFTRQVRCPAFGSSPPRRCLASRTLQALPRRSPTLEPHARATAAGSVGTDVSELVEVHPMEISAPPGCAEARTRVRASERGHGLRRPSHWNCCTGVAGWTARRRKRVAAHPRGKEPHPVRGSRARTRSRWARSRGAAGQSRT